MRGKLLVRIATMLLGTVYDESTPRADMYLPLKLLAMGFVMILGGIGFATAFIFTMELWMIVLAPVCCIVGALAIICWKNQSINIISDNEFVYTTFLGNKYTYRFDEITDLRQNTDSITMFIGKKKVHIENMAVMSEHLRNLINNGINKNNQ